MLGALVVVLAGLAAGSGPVVTSRHVRPPTVPSQLLAPHQSPPRNGSGAGALVEPNARPRPTTTLDVVVFDIVAAVAVGVLGAFFLWPLLRRRRGVGRPAAVFPGGTAPRLPPADHAPRLLAELSRLQGSLPEGGDPRTAVIVCWLGLEDAVAGCGAARSPAESPGDLTRRVLGSFPVDPGTLDHLLHLYATARYSSAPVPPPWRDEARRALDLVRSGIEHGERLGGSGA